LHLQNAIGELLPNRIFSMEINQLKTTDDIIYFTCLIDDIECTMAMRLYINS